MNNLAVLKGHTSQNTAYLVRDYPYGFRLRCKIRYWLEYSKGHGFRLCSQTTNPKVTAEVWNKPKASTYSMLAVMGLDEQQHVTWTGVSMYAFDELEAFEQAYGAEFEETQVTVCKAARAAYQRYQEIKAKRQTEAINA
jgi:hypothetical protein